MRDLILEGRLLPTLEAGDRIVTWKRSDYRSADGTLWPILPVVLTASGELAIMVPQAYRLRSGRAEGGGRGE